MKKTYLLTIALAIITSFSLMGQNLVVNGDLESWDNATTPTGWSVMDNITQESTIVHGGAFAAAQLSEDGSQKFRQDLSGIVGGQEYVISYYYLDNSTAARTRIWAYWMQDGTYLDDNEEELRPTTYSEESPEWVEYTVTLTAPINANEFRFDVRTYKQDGTFGEYIYFDDFSFDGEIIIKPEPSNYPTMFAATAVGLSVELGWDESIGDQLPTGYLVLGEKTGKTSFDVPVDGTPVSDDLDWSDNKVSVNVGYGTGSYNFEGLATNGAYTFTVYPYTNSGNNIDFKTDGTPPVTSATTANISIISKETFDTSLGEWTAYNVFGEQVWEWADYGNPPGCAKGNGYSGAAMENEDWLISPKMNLTNYTNLTFGFDHARNYASNEGLYVMISSDYDGTSDPNNAIWDDITGSFAFPDPGSWDFNPAGTADISAYNIDGIYIAFIYNSTDTDASTWEIDNAEVLGVMGTGIVNNSIKNVVVYPNPASSMINVNSTTEGSIRVISLTGKVVIESEVISGKNSISISNLVSGLYFVEITGVDGQRSIGKFTVK